MSEHMDHAEIRCLVMMSHRAKAMAFYVALFGGTIVLHKDSEAMDAFSAACITGFFLISLYLLMRNVFTRHRFDFALAGVQDDTTRGMLRREHAFRRIAYALFIGLAFLFVAYLGVFQ